MSVSVFFYLNLSGDVSPGILAMVDSPAGKQETSTRDPCSSFCLLTLVSGEIYRAFVSLVEAIDALCLASSSVCVMCSRKMGQERR